MFLAVCRQSDRRVPMYRKCATEISARNQHSITTGLLELMQKIPYEEITVTQICQSAGVSRRIFYHLFSNKTDALYALVDRTILSGESYRPDITDEPLRFCLYWRDQKPLLDALRSSNLSNLLLERMVDNTLSEAYDIRYRLMAVDRDMATDAVIFNLCGIMGLTYGWYYSGYDRSPEEMARRITRLVTPSVSTKSEFTP